MEKFYILVLAVVVLLSVGCDGVLGSSARRDKCGVCGGGNTSCHIISGIFTRRHLPYGYNKVATIPAGACNINITEMFPTRNFLALKLTGGAYVFNGNWKLGRSQDYKAAGTTFKYHRPLPAEFSAGKEKILSTTPTNHSVDIMLLKQQDNLGIMYEYTIPMEPKPTRKTATVTDTRKPQPLTKASGKIQVLDNPKTNVVSSSSPASSPALSDQGGAYSQRSASFSPELRERYKAQYGEDYASYMLGETRNGRTSSGVNTASDNRARGSNTRSSGSNNNQARSSSRTSQVSTAYNNPAPSPSYTPGTYQYSSYNNGGGVTYKQTYRTPAYNAQTGHRVRHRGRHGRRHVDNTSGALSQTTASRSHIPTSQSSSSRSSAALSQTTSSRSYSQSLQSPASQVYTGGATVRTGQSQQSVYPYSSSRSYANYAYPYSSSSSSSQGQQYTGRTYQAQRGVQYSYINPGSYPKRTAPQGPKTYNFYNGRQTAQGSRTYSRAPLNDQIALSLPSRPGGQTSVVDPSADFSWKVSGFSDCSKTCGGGVQTTLIVCVKRGSQAIVTDENCDNALKPRQQSVICNNNPCPASWVAEQWTSCSTSCGRGTQTRTVGCKQVVSDVITLDLPDASCRKRRPPTVRTCNDDLPCVRWRIGEWGKCSAECGRGQRSREVVCVNSKDRPIAENMCEESKPLAIEICDMGSCAQTWFYTQWSEQCSSECGEGVHKRSVFCSAPPDRCNALHKPNQHKACKNDLPCGGKWFTGPWGKCSVTCGSGVIQRDVACMKKMGRLLAVVGEENCLLGEKPETEEACQNPRCKPQWYMTEWTQCSRTCGTGFKTREVKCLDDAQRPSIDCELGDKPEVRKTCNTMACPTTQPASSSSRDKPSSNESGCRDKFRNCRLVVQARLCYYSYYKSICCLSCQGHDKEHQNT